MPLHGEALRPPLEKPEPYQRVKARRKRKAVTKRKACREIVLERANWRCERCGIPISDDLPEWHGQRAQVNEMVPKSRGGDPTNPDECEAICRRCHFGGPSGAHAPTRARMQRT